MARQFDIYGISIYGQEGIYIGATSNINARETNHIRRLIANTHSSPALQTAYNVNRDRFSIMVTIIETFIAQSPEEVTVRELYWQNAIVEEHGRSYLLNHSISSGVTSFASVFK